MREKFATTTGRDRCKIKKEGNVKEKRLDTTLPWTQAPEGSKGPERETLACQGTARGAGGGARGYVPVNKRGSEKSEEACYQYGGTCINKKT